MACAVHLFRRAGRAPARRGQGAQGRESDARGRAARVLLHRPHVLIPRLGAAAREDHDTGNTHIDKCRRLSRGIRCKVFKEFS